MRIATNEVGLEAGDKLGGRVTGVLLPDALGSRVLDEPWRQAGTGAWGRRQPGQGAWEGTGDWLALQTLFEVGIHWGVEREKCD